jgi:8-oxo-dGTP pyrophosphatase MutT (NUDIX family)
MERFKVTPAAHLLLFKEGKTLLSRRFNTGWEDGNYSAIGGHLEGNETVLQATIREAKEEAGIVLLPEDLEFCHIVHRKTPVEERVDFFTTARKWSGEPKIMEPHKCDELKWFDADNLPINTIQYVRQGIECTRKNVFYSECGWD